MSGIDELAKLAGKGLDALERVEQREKDERAELSKAADAVREPLPEPSEPRFGEWINVKERLPEIQVLGIGIEGHPEVRRSTAPMITWCHLGWGIAHCQKDESWISSETGEIEPGVTHWMPLPDPPKDTP